MGNRGRASARQKDAGSLHLQRKPRWGSQILPAKVPFLICSFQLSTWEAERQGAGRRLSLSRALPTPGPAPPLPTHPAGGAQRVVHAVIVLAGLRALPTAGPDLEAAVVVCGGRGHATSHARSRTGPALPLLGPSQFFPASPRLPLPPRPPSRPSQRGPNPYLPHTAPPSQTLPLPTLPHTFQIRPCAYQPRPAPPLPAQPRLFSARPRPYQPRPAPPGSASPFFGPAPPRPYQPLPAPQLSPAPTNPGPPCLPP